MSSVLHVYPLDLSRHDREGFDCGVAELNDYIAKRARKDVASGVAACFVATDEEGGSRIVGYYTLSAATIERALLPERMLKKLPRYPELPATLLGRLAVSTAHCGEGLGAQLLFSAMRRSVDAAAEVASLALVTDPKDEAAESFYRRFGFEALTSHRLFLPMQEVINLLSAR